MLMLRGKAMGDKSADLLDVMRDCLLSARLDDRLKPSLAVTTVCNQASFPKGCIYTTFDPFVRPLALIDSPQFCVKASLRMDAWLQT
eukprot:scaffold27736_cov29-Prasinocladus_malaysianus.AAC.1